MTTIKLTGEELDAVIRYFSNKDIREYMTSRGALSVTIAMADTIKTKLEAAKLGLAPPVPPTPPKKSNPRIDAVWNAIKTASR